MSIFDDAGAAFAEALSIAGSDVTFNGITKKCIASQLDYRNRQEMAGWVGEETGRATMQQVDYDAFVTAGLVEQESAIGIGGHTFLVLSTQKHPSSPIIRINLGPSI